jgi:putative iron-sulfur cluster-binding protein
VAAIKAEALRLGFSACGIARAERVPEEVLAEYDRWIETGYHGDMEYLARNRELRADPRLLLEGTRSLIMVAMNYYPAEKQHPDAPQFAYYAYGRDYHKVVKKRLDQLLHYMRQELGLEVEGRAFSDSAPIMERYWAERAGLGWRGKNSLLIIPRAGSYFFLGELLVDLELPEDEPMRNMCGRCERCLKACPTEAFLSPGRLDARRCISYLTIEQKGEIPPELAERMGRRVYGCDACQQCCPWNRYARPTTIEDYKPREALLSLSPEELEAMTEEEYLALFAGSAVKRVGLSGLQRTIHSLRDNFQED